MPVKYLKDVFYLSNGQPTEGKSYKRAKIYFISTDFPDCHWLLNTLLSVALTWPSEDFKYTSGTNE